ncbi:hypothetical protein CGMCC3_g17413 [Colletotrichum fructicola]|nr:uncharacterized protein CGMCC3_g17413 [Colletotrichum fructicola]KAE9566449.1 hypothetical protein CGMCC3_g17413 [Colletotrichum fructicola]
MFPNDLPFSTRMAAAKVKDASEAFNDQNAIEFPETVELKPDAIRKPEQAIVA